MNNVEIFFDIPITIIPIALSPNKRKIHAIAGSVIKRQDT